jgi:hypothetical protein
MALSTMYNYAPVSPVQITREEYTNVGSGTNILGTYARAFKGSTDFEIWDSAVGGTQLVEDTDYTLETLDTVLTADAGYNVYAEYQVTNATYQTGSIYITYKIVRSYNDADLMNALISATSTAEVEIDDTDSPYTITDISEDNIIVDTSGGDVDITMPTLADNEGRIIKIFHETDGNDLNVDGEGAETIEGLTDIDLPKAGDYLILRGSVNEWKIISENISAQLRLNTYAGFGSVDTKIMRFTNKVEGFGNMFTENHTSGYNGNAEGLEITIVKTGKYSFEFSAKDSSSGYGGLSLDSSQLTTTINLINTTDVLSMDRSTGANSMWATNWSGWLVAGSVVRAHASAIATSGEGNDHFTATYIK